VSEKLERLGNYILLEKINSGGMAEVYLGKSIGANRVNKFWAIKRILPQFADNPEFKEMFKEEAKIAGNLKHNNVVSIIDFKISQKQLYLVMEYVQGHNLRQVLQQKKKKGLPLTLDFMIYVIREVAAGLDHAHRCVDSSTGKPLHIIHRDMSPQNIMISYDGEVKIVDFGIAKAEANGEATRVGTLKGKFAYMSPEQAEGLIIDQSSDIFSLGIILWELIADDRLFIAHDEVNILKRIKECDVPDLRRVNSSVPAELERIVKKALMKDKSQRYQSAAELHKDLTRFLNKEYPDFTPSDFAHFMKFLFEDEYNFTRERMVNYSKMDVSSLPELNEPTHLSTAETTIRASNQSVKPEETNVAQVRALMGLTGDEKSALLNLTGGTAANVDVQNDPTLVAPAPKLPQNTLTGFSEVHPTLKKSPNPGVSAKRPLPHNIATRSGVTKTGIRYRAPAKPPTSESAKALFTFMTVILTLGTIYFISPKLVKTKINNGVKGLIAKVTGQPQPSSRKSIPASNPAVSASTSSAEMASKGNLKIQVNSSPGRARIYINDTDTGNVTPSQIMVPARMPFTLTLLADGYLQYITRITPEREGQIVFAELTPVKFGQLDIYVINGGIDTKIYIDNLELRNRPPITKFPVQPGKPIKIRAEHKFSGLTAEQTVIVGAEEKKRIDLILTKPDVQR
jgi:serine/threonine-protein kinase